jgi:hypothetical protein
LLMCVLGSSAAGGLLHGSAAAAASCRHQLQSAARGAAQETCETSHMQHAPHAAASMCTGDMHVRRKSWVVKLLLSR